jgi:tRNA (guanosine-2'-O-)-methyltransferase
MRGVSDDVIDQANDLLAIPMMGMVQSLNISVACAVTLFEAFRQRRKIHAYDEPKLSPRELQELSEDWLRR